MQTRTLGSSETADTISLDLAILPRQCSVPDVLGGCLDGRKTFRSDLVFRAISNTARDAARVGKGRSHQVISSVQSIPKPEISFDC